ncbi:hypothetical protein CW745_12095 [Psychromonas sp. psych-6C06]|nr:hypothetical protein CW745_12095 [Psychromonas sp. psych-6C06]
MIKYITHFTLIFIFILNSAYTHYFISHTVESAYYLLFYGLAGMFLGAMLLLRWSNVESAAQLATKLNRHNNAEKEDKDSLRYGTLVLLPSLIVVIIALSNIPLK